MEYYSWLKRCMTQFHKAAILFLKEGRMYPKIVLFHSWEAYREYRKSFLWYSPRRSSSVREREKNLKEENTNDV